MFPSIWPSKSRQDESAIIPTNSTEAQPEDTINQTKRNLENVKKHFESLPVPFIALVAFGLGFACSTGSALLFTRYGRRIKNTDWITPEILAKKRWIRGVVTSVGDPDNFRFFHTPLLGGWRWPIKFRRVPQSSKELKDQTLHVRIAGVDAPEAGHFGKPEQPHAAESLAWLRQKILGKPVYCQLIRRDQYQRVVANVHLTPRFLPAAFFFGKSLPLEMLRAGCATAYEQDLIPQAGAEYGKEGKEEYLRIEAEAKAARRGMWAKGVTTETPAEYKRRHSSISTEQTIQDGTERKQQAPSTSGWFSRAFFKR